MKENRSLQNIFELVELKAELPNGVIGMNNISINTQLMRMREWVQKFSGCFEVFSLAGKLFPHCGFLHLFDLNHEVSRNKISGNSINFYVAF